MWEMPLHRWIAEKRFADARKREMLRLEKKARKVITHKETEIKSVSDFPVIAEYLSVRFPDVDVSDIAIHLSPPRVVERSGWRDIGGCYIRHMRVIIVKNKIETHRSPKGAFEKLMRQQCPLDATQSEDVVVHELIHAISDRIGRSSSRFTHMEEEFVYTNCIDFYKQKGMTESDIVDHNFLPFCLHDVYSSRKEMSSLFGKVGSSLGEVRNMTKSGYRAFLNKHASVFVPLVKEKAQQKAQHMIELYKRYGEEIYRTAAVDPTEDKIAARFASLEID